MTESCRLITTEQYQEWKASEKKLEIATKALEEIMYGVGSGKYNDYAIMCCANDAFCKIKGGKYDLGRTKRRS